MRGAYCSKCGDRTVLNAGSAVLNAGSTVLNAGSTVLNEGSDTIQKRLSFLAFCSRKKQLGGLEIIFIFEQKD